MLQKSARLSRVHCCGIQWLSSHAQHSGYMFTQHRWNNGSLTWRDSGVQDHRSSSQLRVMRPKAVSGHADGNTLSSYVHKPHKTKVHTRRVDKSLSTSGSPHVDISA